MKKKFQFQMCVWVVARLSRLKSTFFEISSSLWVLFRDPPFKKYFKNLDFSLFLAKCTFFLVLARYVLYVQVYIFLSLLFLKNWCLPIQIFSKKMPPSYIWVIYLQSTYITYNSILGVGLGSTLQCSCIEARLYVCVTP